MPKPFELLGLGPTYSIRKVAENEWEITVTAPAFGGGQVNTVTLTDAQYSGFHKWRGGELIQDALPDLSPNEREILLTGLNNDQFQAAATWDPYEGAIEVPCIDGTEDHIFVVSDEDENICYCERCGCMEY